MYGHSTCSHYSALSADALHATPYGHSTRRYTETGLLIVHTRRHGSWYRPTYAHLPTFRLRFIIDVTLVETLFSMTLLRGRAGGVQHLDADAALGGRG
jgi:hypothetical protein